MNCYLPITINLLPMQFDNQNVLILLIKTTNLRIMKSIFMVLLFFAFAQKDYAQISAKTANGRNVVLNKDGSWKYSEKELIQDEQSGCEKAHTGNLTVINNNKFDLYFYYGAYVHTPQGLYMVKVKSGSRKLIKDIEMSSNGGMFQWKAVLEKSDATPMSSMEGISNGTFLLEQCGNKELEIDD